VLMWRAISACPEPQVFAGAARSVVGLADYLPVGSGRYWHPLTGCHPTQETGVQMQWVTWRAISVIWQLTGCHLTHETGLQTQCLTWRAMATRPYIKGGPNGGYSPRGTGVVWSDLGQGRAPHCLLVLLRCSRVFHSILPNIDVLIWAPEQTQDVPIWAPDPPMMGT
jgi:hypothetical protein